MARSLILVSVLCIAASGPPCAAGESGRWAKLCTRYRAPEQPVRIVRAGCLDAGGAEWLAAAMELPGGRWLIAGNTVGPRFAPRLPSGTEITVIGADTPAPDGRRAPWRDGKGAAIVDATGAAMEEPPGWDARDATGVLWLMDAELSAVERAWRLPWSSGAIVDACVGGDGRVALALRAGPKHGRLLRHADHQAEASAAGGASGLVVQFNLSSTEAWVATAVAVDAAAMHLRLTALEDGRIAASGRALTRIDRQGRSSDWPVPGNLRVVLPAGTTAAALGDRNTNMGHGPWRQPYAHIHDQDGRRHARLWSWPPGLVVSPLDYLTADAGFRAGAPSRDGRFLWLSAWSHGGNTMMVRQPLDLWDPVPPATGGFTAYRQGDVQTGHLMRLDLDTLRVDRFTWLIAYTRVDDKGNSLFVRDLVETADGSVAMTGDSASGFVMTGDHLYAGRDNPAWAPGGAFAMVMDGGLRGLRFASVLPAVGDCAIDGRRDLAVATGATGRVLVCGGAVRERRLKYDAQHLPPPVQGGAAFGGGASDGWFLLLDTTP